MNKTFSERKIFFILVILLVLCGVVAGVERISSPASLPQPITTTFTYATTTISAPNGQVVAQIADTIDKQTQGLSDRTSLPQGAGMLFVFTTPAPQYMWMKDMNFPLDMVWLDKDRNVVNVVADATSESYKRPSPEIFFSFTDALYVIELPNGDANRLGITVGTRLNFDLSK